MINIQFRKSILFVICIGIIVIAQCSNAYAWLPRKTHPQHFHHPRRAVPLPAKHTKIVISGLPYYYYSGVYYRRGPSRYVVVTAPFGAVVPTLPVESQIVAIDGQTYYTYDNTYYVHGSSGYTVVQTPVVKNVVTQKITSSSEDSFVVNVPNSNGSFTPVVLKKSGDGYIGPQGEYYPQNPTIEQLKAMYAK